MAAVTVTSLNVGLPQEVAWSGRTVLTGAWKGPVTDRRTVTRLNIDGDGQGDLAGHGGPNRAVLVYQEAAYAFWRELLGRPELTAGRLGDNLTIDGFPDDEVRIGDRFRIGTAELEVSQPRVTCFRVGMRNDEPRLASLMVKHGRPGFYLRVLVEGEIGAGDEVTLVAKDPAGLTVAAVNALLYLPDPDLEQVAVARDHPALSEGWRGSFAEMLGPDAASGSSEEGPGWAGFRPLRVERVQRETPTVTSFYFTEPEGLRLPAARAGQYLTLRLAGEGTASPLVRNYSLSSPADGGGYRISVKREPRGAFSNLLHDTVAAGDIVQVAAPRGEFVLGTGHDPVVLVSAGIGITPVLSMLHQLVTTDDGRDIWWLHGTRTLEEYPLIAEIHALAARTPRLRAHTWLSRDDAPAGEPALGSWHRGRMTTEALRTLDLPRDARAYVCGPTSFIEAVTESLVELGLSRSAVASELFGTLASLNPGIVGQQPQPPHPPDHIGAGPVVTFTRSLLEVPWSEEYRTLLELAEACDVPTRWSCRTGVCHNCVTPLVAGSVTYVEEPLTDPEPGTALICCSRPDGEVVLDL